MRNYQPIGQICTWSRNLDRLVQRILPTATKLQHWYSLPDGRLFHRHVLCFRLLAQCKMSCVSRKNQTNWRWFYVYPHLSGFYSKNNFEIYSTWSSYSHHACVCTPSLFSLYLKGYSTKLLNINILKTEKGKSNIGSHNSEFIDKMHTGSNCCLFRSIRRRTLGCA